MAIVECLLTLLALGGFFLAFASVGNALLRSFRFEMESDSEHILVAVGLGLISTEIILFAIESTQHIRAGCRVLVALLTIVLLFEFSEVYRRMRGVAHSIWPRTIHQKILSSVTLLVFCVEFFAALAPLTGSDAQHYHFTTPKLILAHGFHPIFSSSHSFLCGQHHLLILLGLALGSEKLSLGFIFLGGLLSAAVLACLAAQWSSERPVWLVVLLFVLTPVVFWQICTSGAPDIYMAYLTGAVLLVLNNGSITRRWQIALISGLLSGGIVGAKYTGGLIAAALLLALLTEFASVLNVIIFLAANAVTGIWPYLRNMWWTGDPVFPFLAARFAPRLVTAFALENLATDTGASSRHVATEIPAFLLFAATRANNPALWDFFGPTVLALAPLVLLAFKNQRPWRIALLVWSVSAAAMFLVSGLPRFLLPIFPVALACVAGGVELSRAKQWKIATAFSVATVELMILAGMIGLAQYCAKPFLVSVGLMSREAYLVEKSQDYEAQRAINQLLGDGHAGATALVFLRHQYYLDVPYLNGDPGTSFEVDPEKLRTADEWKEFLKRKNLKYVVKAPEYPPSIRAPLDDLEKQGVLKPIAQRPVESLFGLRVNNVRSGFSVVILEADF